MILTLRTAGLFSNRISSFENDEKISDSVQVGVSLAFVLLAMFRSVLFSHTDVIFHISKSTLKVHCFSVFISVCHFQFPKSLNSCLVADLHMCLPPVNST